MNIFKKKRTFFRDYSWCLFSLFIAHICWYVTMINKRKSENKSHIYSRLFICAYACIQSCVSSYAWRYVQDRQRKRTLSWVSAGICVLCKNTQSKNKAESFIPSSKHRLFWVSVNMIIIMYISLIHMDLSTWNELWILF